MYLTDQTLQNNALTICYNARLRDSISINVKHDDNANLLGLEQRRQTVALFDVHMQR